MNKKIVGDGCRRCFKSQNVMGDHWNTVRVAPSVIVLIKRYEGTSSEIKENAKNGLSLSVRESEITKDGAKFRESQVVGGAKTRS